MTKYQQLIVECKQDVATMSTTPNKLIANVCSDNDSKLHQYHWNEIDND